MQKVITKDNSETFFNELVGESYHSHSGAVEEALKKYGIPCKIAEKAKSGQLKILDFCFGMGYNSALAIDLALESNPECEVEVIGLELDPEIINKIQEVNLSIKFFQYYKQLTPQKLQFQQGKVKVTVLLGDARETAKTLLNEYFDAIFYDPFSPQTAPEMWSLVLFQEMYRTMKKDAILATYSCARIARDNMAEAGLFYDDGPILGRRGPGTIATKWI